MFVASQISTARAIGVLLGGSGLGQSVAPPDVGALLMPRRPRADQDGINPACVASVNSLWQAGRHD